MQPTVFCVMDVSGAEISARTCGHNGSAVCMKLNMSIVIADAICLQMFRNEGILAVATRVWSMLLWCALGLQVPSKLPKFFLFGIFGIAC